MAEALPFDPRPRSFVAVAPSPVPADPAASAAAAAPLTKPTPAPASEVAPVFGPPATAGAAAATSVPALDAASPPAQHDGWQRYVARVRAQAPALASVLEHGRLVDYGLSGITVAYPRGSFYLATVRGPDEQALAQQLLEVHMGHPARLSVVSYEADQMAGAPSLAEAHLAQAASGRASLEAIALAHPAVLHVSEMLGAELTGVTALAARPLGTNTSAQKA